MSAIRNSYEQFNAAVDRSLLANHGRRIDDAAALPALAAFIAAKDLSPTDKADMLTSFYLQTQGQLGAATRQAILNFVASRPSAKGRPAVDPMVAKVRGQVYQAEVLVQFAFDTLKSLRQAVELLRLVAPRDGTPSQALRRSRQLRLDLVSALDFVSNTRETASNVTKPWLFDGQPEGVGTPLEQRIGRVVEGLEQATEINGEVSDKLRGLLSAEPTVKREQAALLLDVVEEAGFALSGAQQKLRQLVKDFDAAHPRG
jgi:hypothetical protein